MNIATIICPSQWAEKHFRNWLNRRFPVWVTRTEYNNFGRPIRLIAVTGTRHTQTELTLN